MKRPPKFLKKYFWEIDFDKMEFEDRKVYILKRILEYGDEDAVRWIWKNFKGEEMKDVLCNFRDYSLKTANFWALILGVPKERVKCLQKSYLERRKIFWPY